MHSWGCGTTAVHGHRGGGSTDDPADPDPIEPLGCHINWLGEPHLCGVTGGSDSWPPHRGDDGRGVLGSAAIAPGGRRWPRQHVNRPSVQSYGDAGQDRLGQRPGTLAGVAAIRRPAR